MKNTIIMLVALGTFFITWLFVSLLFWYLSDVENLRQSASYSFIIILLVGWIPSVIICVDLHDKLTKQ